MFARPKLIQCVHPADGSGVSRNSRQDRVNRYRLQREGLLCIAWTRICESVAGRPARCMATVVQSTGMQYEQAFEEKHLLLLMSIHYAPKWGGVSRFSHLSAAALNLSQSKCPR